MWECENRRNVTIQILLNNVSTSHENNGMHNVSKMMAEFQFNLLPTFKGYDEDLAVNVYEDF